jgi:hypothetical protein
LLAPGATTVVAHDADGEVIGFAHALSDGVTIYLAELLVAPRTATVASGDSWLMSCSNGAALCAWISSPTAPKPSTRACRIGAMPVPVFTRRLVGRPRVENAHRSLTVDHEIRRETASAPAIAATTVGW